MEVLVSQQPWQVFVAAQLRTSALEAGGKVVLCVD